MANSQESCQRFDSGSSSLDFCIHPASFWAVDELRGYQRAALKRAVVKYLGPGDGYSAKIPGFAGLIVFGDSKREALAELESALSGWIEISLKRHDGLPALHGELAKTR